MQKFNLVTETIVVEKTALIQAIGMGKPFGITYNGEIISDPIDKEEIFIFLGTILPQSNNVILGPKSKLLQELFGTAYKIEEQDETVTFNAELAWELIISFNSPHASYDDTTSDGIGEFTDGPLEDIGWQATEFDITYRTLSEVIEQSCDGILLCIEREEPYFFSGLAFIKDHDCARKKVFSFCQSQIKSLMENDPDFAKDNLTDSEEEAAEFFKLL